MQRLASGPATVTTGDRARQVAVTVSELVCIVGTLIGTGVLGARVEETAGGALSATATLVAPASPAFSIWSVIYLGLAAYTVWQWLPTAAVNPRNRSVGWLIAASMLLNASWLLVTQFSWLWASVVVIVALLAVLAVALRRLSATAPTGRVEAIVLDGTVGLYLGWVSVATCANITATLVAEGVRPGAGLAQALAVVVVLAVGVIGVTAIRTLGAPLAFAAAAAWGLVWVAVARLSTAPQSSLVAVASLVAAGAILAAVVARAARARA